MLVGCLHFAACAGCRTAVRGGMDRHVDEDPGQRWKSLGLKLSRIGVAAPEELWGTGL